MESLADFLIRATQEARESAKGFANLPSGEPGTLLDLLRVALSTNGHKVYQWAEKNRPEDMTDADMKAMVNLLDMVTWQEYYSTKSGS